METVNKFIQIAWIFAWILAFSGLYTELKQNSVPDYFPGLAAFTDNEALESICRILGLRANNPTLGVQHAICLHHIRISTIVFPSFGRCENHATSHVNLDTKSHRSHLQALLTDLWLHYQCW